jgi:hypothetical protein
MPPNRKEIGSTLVSFDFSDHFVTSSKYQPFILTGGPNVTEQCKEPTSTPPKGIQDESNEPLPSRNEELSRILKEEEAHQALSCDNIVANLIADSRYPQCDRKSQMTSDVQSDSYWDMPSDESNETDYFSVGFIERKLVKVAAQRIQNTEHQVVTAAHVHDKSHPNQYYWGWKSSPVTHREKSTQIIATILQDEAIRQLLSIENLSLKEKSAPTIKAFAPEVKNPYLVLTHEASHDYWSWTSEEEKVEEAPHTSDPTHPNHQYWDFHSEPESDESAKKGLIDMILQHEKIRQILCCDNTERRETSSRSKDKFDTTRCTSEFPKLLSPSTPHQGYWDFHTNTLPHSQEKSKVDIIDQILREYKALQATSTDKIVENLENGFHANVQHGRMVSISNSEQSPYWDWSM